MAELLIKNQKTPLSRAAERGDEIVVKLLLENGSRPDFEDEGWQTPLSRVVERGSVTVVRLLLAKEAKMDYKYNNVS
jgi:ankyrin repeat protein